ncbi:MAG TPA: sensor histidine kinase [Gammaproteobacteria bacterium]
MIDPTQPHMHLVTFAPIHGPDHNAPLGVLGLYGVMEPGILPYPFIQFLIGAIFGLPPAAVFIYGCVRLYRRRQGNLHSGHESLQLHDADAVRCHTITAQETERKRISQDLHDGICQYLNAIKLRLQNISTGLAANHAADACTEIEEVVQVVTSASDEVRRISLALRPAMLDDLGLVATLNWLCREFSSTHPDIALIKDVNIQEQDIPDRLKTTIFRISQEALTNVAKHSHATHVHIALEVETGDKGSSLSLTVTDNGRGFDPSAERCHIRSDGGLGMHSMRERAQLDGGMLQIHSAQDTGTRIRARWPIQQAITHPDLSQNP